jgi:hypothetical protein
MEDIQDQAKSKHEDWNQAGCHDHQETSQENEGREDRMLF